MTRLLYAKISNVVANVLSPATSCLQILPLVIVLAIASAGFESAHAQPYPYRPVRMVIGSAPGSGNDIAG